MKKKCNPRSFPLLGGCNWTRALQSSPFQIYKNFKKSQKLLSFKTKQKIDGEKMCKKNAIVLVFQYK